MSLVTKNRYFVTMSLKSIVISCHRHYFRGYDQTKLTNINIKNQPNFTSNEIFQIN